MRRKKTDYAVLSLRIREALREQLEQAARANDTSINAELTRRIEESFRHSQTETLLGLLLGEPGDAAMLLTLVARALRLSPGWTSNSETRRVLRIAIDCMIEACAGKKPEQLPPEIAAEKLTPDVKGKAQAMAILLFEPREKLFPPVKEDKK